MLACTGTGDTASHTLRAVTFNTGLGAAEGDLAETLDTWFGNGLAWTPAVEAARHALDIDADIVAFQESFDPARCEDIPTDQHPGTVCQATDRTHVALQVLGPDWQLACHPGNDDKCVAVHPRLGSIGDMTGQSIEGCGGGARVARLEVATDDGPLVVVSVHGSSGLDGESIDCRVQQAGQAFAMANGERNLILGDLNTDPGRFTGYDDSAVAWAALPFGWGWLTEVGPDAPGTYGGLADIDHMASDALVGDCHVAGLDNPDDVFDHVPIVCDLR